MGAREERPTLEGLAQRLEALEHENAELRSKLATLEVSGTRRDKPAEIKDPDACLYGEPAAAPEGQVSRRALLTKAGAAAVAAMAAGTLLHPRQARADHHAPGIFVDFVNAHRDGNNIAVEGNSQAGTGVFGIGKYGVWGESRLRGHTAVVGRNLSDYGFGVLGEGRGVGAGVVGRNGDGFAGGTGVQGEGSDRGIGVYGKSGIGTGVDGESTRGTAVRGWSRGDGIGGYFIGGRAQLKLAPGGTPGRPTTGFHSQGELYMDSNASLFVCVENGTPGTWKRFTTN